jgi:hypothetical protein
MKLAVSFGQLPLQGLALLAVLAHFGFDLPDVLVDLLTVIAPHRRHEVTRLGFLEGISRLSVNVRLHVARSWLDVTTEGSRVLHRVIGPTIRIVGLRLPSSDTHITPTSAIR